VHGWGGRAASLRNHSCGRQRAAVENGQVDAAFVVEPFVTAALDSDQRVISYGFADFNVNLDVAGYFALADTVANDRELVTKFQTAMTKSPEYAHGCAGASRRGIRCSGAA